MYAEIIRLFSARRAFSMGPYFGQKANIWVLQSETAFHDWGAGDPGQNLNKQTSLVGVADVNASNK